MYNLQGKVALVTGSARYPSSGRSIALRLAEEGADVAVNGRYRSPEQFTDEEMKMGWRGVETVQQEIKSLGRKSTGIWADVADPADVQRMFKEVVDRLGRIDILVNNAAVIPLCELLDTDIETWNQCLAVDLTGPFLCSREAARHMIEQGKGGKIVHISSRAGQVGLPSLGAYSAAKFGLNGLTQVMAIEWARHKINVNAICLGAVQGSGNERRSREASTTEEKAQIADRLHRTYQERIKAIPLGRVATQEDLANLVCFLASDQSDFITGEAVDLTGGHSFTQR